MKQSVFFATPTYDYQFCAEFTASMMMTSIHLTHLKVDVRAQFVGGMCFIDLARNKLTSAFLKTDCTHLFFVDADVGWDYRVVKRFLDYDEEVVGGLVPKRKVPTFYHDNALTGEIQNNLIGTLEVPTAFLCIKRSAIERYMEHYPDFATYYTLDCGSAVFQTGWENKNFMGEDIFWCRKWTAMGGKIWIDPQVDFTHRGSHVWEGNFIHHAMEKGIITASQEPICQVEPVSRTGT